MTARPKHHLYAKRVKLLGKVRLPVECGIIKHRTKFEAEVVEKNISWNSIGSITLLDEITCLSNTLPKAFTKLREYITLELSELF